MRALHKKLGPRGPGGLDFLHPYRTCSFIDSSPGVDSCLSPSNSGVECLGFLSGTSLFKPFWNPWISERALPWWSNMLLGHGALDFLAGTSLMVKNAYFISQVC